VASTGSGEIAGGPISQKGSTACDIEDSGAALVAIATTRAFACFATASGNAAVVHSAAPAAQQAVSDSTTLHDPADGLYQSGETNNIYMEDPTGGADQVWDIKLLPDVCNGNSYVTSTCPFTVGSGDNTAMIGDPIYEQYNPKHGYCAGVGGSEDDMEVPVACGD
jgi:hypothetical protein